jgi:hypothetical protein
VSERIRPYRAEDAAAVREVHLQAFDGRRDEPRLVELLHAAGAAPVSLVAAAEPDGRVVGHVLLCRSAGAGPTCRRWWGWPPSGCSNVTGSPGFCTLERIPAEPNSLGYDFLVRFFVRATGNLAVTIRVEDTEQVFCTSQAGGAITFANLTQHEPQFVEVSLDQVRARNPDVRQIIR